MMPSLCGPVDPLWLGAGEDSDGGKHVGPGFVSGPTGWDTSRPLLAAVLVRMEDLATPTVKAVGAMIYYHPLMAATMSSPRRPEADPFDLDALLREQVSEAELVMAALRGVPTEHHAIIRSSHLPTLMPSETGPDGRDLCLRIRVTWVPPREMFVHAPMKPMPQATTA